MTIIDNGAGITPETLKEVLNSSGITPSLHAYSQSLQPFERNRCSLTPAHVSIRCCFELTFSLAFTRIFFTHHSDFSTFYVQTVLHLDSFSFESFPRWNFVNTIDCRDNSSSKRLVCELSRPTVLISIESSI